jgi:thiol-disulfide isomerase/thioredoxin
MSGLFFDPLNQENFDPLNQENFDPLKQKNKDYFTNSKYVKELNPETLDNILKDKNKTGFIMFYADWCPHCKNMIETWESLALHLHDSIGDDDIVIKAFNCANESNINKTTELKISGYPTIKFLKNTQLEDYSGKREVKNFTDYLFDNLKCNCNIHL